MKNVLLDTWGVFAVVFVVVTLGSSLFGGESLLRSDDPYLFGFMFSGFISAIALIHSFVTRIPETKQYQNGIVVSSIVLWSAFWIVFEFFHDGEGDGLSIGIGLISLLVGAVAWFLCKLKLPSSMLIVSSIAAMTLIGGYIYVTTAVLR